MLRFFDDNGSTLQGLKCLICDPRNPPTTAPKMTIDLSTEIKAISFHLKY